MLQSDRFIKKQLFSTKSKIYTIKGFKVLVSGSQGDYNHKKMVTSDEVAASVLFMLKNSTNCTIDELDIAPGQGIALQ